MKKQPLVSVIVPVYNVEQYLEECMANAIVPQEPYRSRMAEFFLHRDGNCRDRLYEALTDKN